VTNGTVGGLANTNNDGRNWTATITPIATAPVTVRIAGGAAVAFDDRMGNAASNTLTVQVVAQTQQGLTVENFTDPDNRFADLPFTNGRTVFEEGQRGLTDVLFNIQITEDKSITIRQIAGPTGVLTPDKTRVDLTPTNDVAASDDSEVIFTAAEDDVYTGDREVTFEFVAPGATAFIQRFLIRDNDPVPDTTAPTVTLTKAPATVEPVTGTFAIAVNFSEPVTGFTAEDLTVGNGSVMGSVLRGPQSYTADITPDAGFRGAVTIDVAADVAQDAAGNGNEAATQLSVMVDLAPPVSIPDTNLRTAVALRPC